MAVNVVREMMQAPETVPTHSEPRTADRPERRRVFTIQELTQLGTEQPTAAIRLRHITSDTLHSGHRPQYDGFCTTTSLPADTDTSTGTRVTSSTSSHVRTTLLQPQMVSYQVRPQSTMSLLANHILHAILFL